MSSSKPLHGIVRGRTIELSVDPGVESGVEVEVILRRKATLPSDVHGLSNCADAIAYTWTEEDDRILAEIQAARHRGYPA